MASYDVALIKREHVAEGTTAFHFEKPERFEFKAGQFLDWVLVNPPETDEEGNVRAFSIASAPYEPDLMLTTRMRDTAFKRVLKSMPIGSKITIKGPSGSFTLHNDVSKPAVFLMGGIGITPARAIVLQAAYEKKPHAIFLFYSNRIPKDAPFLKELQDIKNPNYTFIPTMTEMPTRLIDEEKLKEQWNGERGYITKEMISKYISDLQKPIYYVAGPQTMVMAMRKMLNDAGIDDDNIRSEEFTGY